MDSAEQAAPPTASPPVDAAPVADGKLPLYGRTKPGPKNTGPLKIITSPEIETLRSVGMTIPVFVDRGTHEVFNGDIKDALFMHPNHLTDAEIPLLLSFPNLTQVSLTETKITDEGAATLGKLQGLKKLNIDGASGISDAGLEHLKNLHHLEHLTIYASGITDEGVAHLSGMKKLSWLSLSKCFLTDACISHLDGLTELTSLNLSENQISEAGRARLQQAHPNCRMNF